MTERNKVESFGNRGFDECFAKWKELEYGTKEEAVARWEMQRIKDFRRKLEEGFESGDIGIAKVIDAARGMYIGDELAVLSRGLLKSKKMEHEIDFGVWKRLMVMALAFSGGFEADEFDGVLERLDKLRDDREWKEMVEFAKNEKVRADDYFGVLRLEYDELLGIVHDYFSRIDKIGLELGGLKTYKRLVEVNTKSGCCNWFTSDPDKMFKKGGEIVRKLREKELRVGDEDVTLGIEIEVFEPGVPEGIKQRNTNEEELKDYYRQRAIKLNIPLGKDGVVEFSLYACNNPQLITRQVYELFRLGWLTEDYRCYPLHITIGGIESGEKSKLLWLGVASTKRIATAKRLLDREWTNMQKTKDGTSQKNHLPEGSVLLNARKAVEGRPFYLTGVVELGRSLEYARCLGKALKAHQSMPLTRSRRSESLSRIWVEYEEKLIELCEKAGVEFGGSLEERVVDDWKTIRELGLVFEKVNTNASAREFVNEARMLELFVRKKVHQVEGVDG